MTQSLYLVLLPGFEVVGFLFQALWFFLLFFEAQLELPVELWILHRTAMITTINVHLIIQFWESFKQQYALNKWSVFCFLNFPGHSENQSSWLFYGNWAPPWGWGGSKEELCPQPKVKKNIFTSEKNILNKILKGWTKKALFIYNGHFCVLLLKVRF